MKRFLPFANILATALALVVNVLASALPLNGKNTGAISDQFKVLFVPAGYVSFISAGSPSRFIKHYRHSAQMRA